MPYINLTSRILNTRWIAASNLDQLLDIAFGTDFTVVANRTSMISAIKRMSAPAPYSVTSRFPMRRFYIPLVGEVFNSFNRLVFLLSQRDRSANINAEKQDSRRVDDNLRALSTLLESLNEMREQQRDYYDRERFESEYIWEDSDQLTRSSLTDDAGLRAKIDELTNLVSKITKPSNVMRNVFEIPRSNQPVRYTPEEVEKMANWSHPVPYKLVQERVLKMKADIIHRITSGGPRMVVPGEDELQELAIKELQNENLSLQREKSRDQPSFSFASFPDAEDRGTSRNDEALKPGQSMSFRASDFSKSASRRVSSPERRNEPPETFDDLSAPSNSETAPIVKEVIFPSRETAAHEKRRSFTAAGNGSESVDEPIASFYSIGPDVVKEEEFHRPDDGNDK